MLFDQNRSRLSRSCDRVSVWSFCTDVRATTRYVLAPTCSPAWESHAVGLTLRRVTSDRPTADSNYRIRSDKDRAGRPREEPARAQHGSDQ